MSIADWNGKSNFAVDLDLSFPVPDGTWTTLSGNSERCCNSTDVLDDFHLPTVLPIHSDTALNVKIS